jgi:DNA-binding LacI/PurR family transcriptional regulator
MKNTQYTLLKMAGDLNLSRTTVSVCLSGDAGKGRIKPETVERVKKYAEKINYIPNRIARNLVKPGKPPIGLIVSQDSSSEKSLHAINTAMKMLDENGREFIVHNFLSNHVPDAVSVLKGMGVREIIMFGLFTERVNSERKPKDSLMKFRTDQAGLVSLLRDVRFYSVDYDFPMPENSPLKICRMGVSRRDIYTKLFIALSKAGKFPLVCDESCVSSHGTRNNFTKTGFEIKPEHILIMPSGHVDSPFELGRKLVPQLVVMIKSDQIKTVVLHDDKVAAGLIDGLLENGYSIPGDVSVIGFDDIDASPYFKVPLTTIRLPVMENTIVAVESILSGKDIPEGIESEAEIIWRDSARI